MNLAANVVAIARLSKGTVVIPGDLLRGVDAVERPNALKVRFGYMPPKRSGRS